MPQFPRTRRTDSKPGPSGNSQTISSRENSVEKYRTTKRSMIMGPNGKLISFVTFDRMTKEDSEGKDGIKDKEAGKDSPDPPKYKYIL